MEKKEYLNEENYQKTKNRIKILAILVLITGLLIGGGLIVTGIIRNNQAELTTEEVNKVQTEIDGYNTQLASLKSQKSEEFQSNGFSEKYYKLGNEIDKVEDKIDELEESLDIDTSWLVVFYIFGSFIVIVTFIISSCIFAVANRREINAFYVQQQMPLAQEGIEKMAPSVGKAAKEIAKGIKEGLDDDQNK